MTIDLSNTDLVSLMAAIIFAGGSSSAVECVAMAENLFNIMSLGPGTAAEVMAKSAK